MLNQESIETYKSIRLPRDLRADILARHTRQHSFVSPKFLRPAAALCSLVLILTVLVAVVTEPGSVYVSGEKIGSTPHTVQTQSVSFIGGAMRASIDPSPSTPLRTAQTCIPLSLQFGENVYLVVHNGSLLLPDGNDHFVFAGQAGEVKDETDVYWVVDSCVTASPLTAEVFALDGGRLAVLTLTYDAADSIWQIAKNSSEK